MTARSHPPLEPGVFSFVERTPDPAGGGPIDAGRRMRARLGSDVAPRGRAEPARREAGA